MFPEKRCPLSLFKRKDVKFPSFKTTYYFLFHGTQEPHQRVAGRTLGNTALENAQEILNPKMLIKYIGVLSIEAHR